MYLTAAPSRRSGARLLIGIGVCFMILVVDGQQVLSFSTTYERRWGHLIMSLLTWPTGGGWSTGIWKVWATTEDGQLSILRDAGGDSYARQAVQAYTGQLANLDAIDWAYSKGFTALAKHLEQLYGS